MTKQFSFRSLRAAGIAVLTLFGLSAQVTKADLVSFDPDGAGGLTPISFASIDYKPGNGIFSGLGSTQVNKNNQPFTYYYQTRINNFLDSNSQVIPVAGLNQPGGFELTVVFGYSGATDPGTPSLQTYSLAGAPSVNFFKIFYDSSPATRANDLAGTGFDNGTTILSGQFTQADGTYTISSSPASLFDGNGVDNYGGFTSLISAGGADYTVESLVPDPAFFLALPGGALSLSMNSSNVTPFNQVDPSQKFMPATVNYTPVLGAVNGTGSDFQVQSDGNAVFIPEPTTWALAGLAVCGLLIRKRR
jgi:hypothetical protein